MWDGGMKKLAGLLAAAWIVGFGGAAQAALVGDIVDCSTSDIGVACNPTSAEVESNGATDVEFGILANTFFTVNLNDLGVIFMFNNAFQAEPSLAVTFSDLDFSSGDVLTGFENLQISQGLADFTAGDITTTADSFTVNLAGVSAATYGENFSFDFVTGPATTVPLPAAIWMLGGALFLLGAGRRLSKTA